MNYELQTTNYSVRMGQEQDQAPEQGQGQDLVLGQDLVKELVQGRVLGQDLVKESDQVQEALKSSLAQS